MYVCLVGVGGGGGGGGIVLWWVLYSNNRPNINNEYVFCSAIPRKKKNNALNSKYKTDE